MHFGVLVLNNCETPLNYTSWQDAVTKVVTGEAVIVEGDPERTVRSPSMEIPFPRVIRLVRWVYVKYIRAVSFEGGIATRKAVLNRDKHTCVYCGQANATTVDHVFPKSRGGRDTWENLAACCKRCNNVKADRTPQEAGMRLRWHPWCPDLTGYTKRKVWLEPVTA